MKAWLWIAVLALPLACEKKPEPSPTTTTTPSPTPTATQGTTNDQSGATQPASAQADEGADIPTEQDFEDEAEQKITAGNLDDELGKLEKEITEGS